MSKIPVGILGCTGNVGQRFVEQLNNHPNFEIKIIGASLNSAGKRFRDATTWRLQTPLPDHIANMTVVECSVANFQAHCKVVFSALDSSVAEVLEEEFMKAGFAVFTNAKTHRMDPDVPVLIPYINPDHINIIDHQRKNRGISGMILANSNCTCAGVSVVLAPLIRHFGVSKCFVVTLQAISGAGYPGISAMDIFDNVVPYIGEEEEKLETEPLKILGSLNDTKDQFSNVPNLQISASVNRVAVLDGHTASISVKLDKETTVEEVKRVLAEFKSDELRLPSGPQNPIVVLEENDRPQPRLDRMRGNGYTVTVGRVRKCALYDFKMTVLSHNTILGAAGGSVLNAELAFLHGLLN